MAERGGFEPHIIGITGYQEVSLGTQETLKFQRFHAEIIENTASQGRAESCGSATFLPPNEKRAEVPGRSSLAVRELDNVYEFLGVKTMEKESLHLYYTPHSTSVYICSIPTDIGVQSAIIGILSYSLRN